MHEETMKKYSANLPYPTLNIQYQNPDYGKILLEDYAGQGSEMHAVFGYIYGHFVTNSYPEICDALKGISIVEMKHMEMLAETIGMLGIDPRYRTLSADGKDVYWCAKDMGYEKSINSIFLNALEGERKAIAQYQAHIALIDDPEITALLKRIILDEEVHLDLLNQLYVKYNSMPLVNRTNIF